MKKLLLLSTLSLLSVNSFADEECSKSYERGQRVFTYSNYTYNPGSIVKQRSNENYVIKTNSETNTDNLYQTNIAENEMFVSSGCAHNTYDESTSFTIGDHAYLYTYSNYEYHVTEVQIEAFNSDSTSFIYTQVLDEESQTGTEVTSYPYGGIDNLYSKYKCSTATDDGVEICAGDTAISLDYSVDVQIIGIKDSVALVSYGETVYNVNIANLIKTESNSSIEP